MHRLTDLFQSRFAALTLLMIFLQQLVVSSSNLWLRQLSEAISANQTILVWLLAYAVSLVLPYIPGTLYLIFKTSWSEDSLKSYYKTFFTSFRYRADLWSDVALKKDKESFLTSEGPQSLRDFIDYFSDVFTVSLNVGLNVLALVLLVEPLYAVSLTVSLVVVALVIQVWNRKLESLQLEAQKSRNSLTSKVSSIWDNVSLGTDALYSRWYQAFEQPMTRRIFAQNRVERARQSLSLVLSIITFVPTLAVAIWQVMHHQQNPAQALAIVLTLPRLFMIMANFHTLLSQWGAWSAEKSRMIATLAAVQKMPAASLETRVQFDRLSLKSSEGVEIVIKSVDDIAATVNEKPGRYTLRGPNGCGKSSALLVLKSLNPKSTVFVPANHSLYASGFSDNPMSTGQKTIEFLNDCITNERISSSGHKTFLIDEWDANLDADNIKTLSDKIDSLSKHATVVEVRHRD
jgi:ABC-type bacteriocin/lantibiotic exporter with double-glycine peptidase domain